MPRAVLGKQQGLYDNTATNHIYGLDGTPVIGVSDDNFDGTIDPADDFVGAVFTQRRGGDHIYALDLTPSEYLDGDDADCGAEVSVGNFLGNHRILAAWADVVGTGHWQHPAGR